MADRLERAAARVLLLDDRDRLLLFHGGDPARPQDGTWWFTPGGGLEPGESAEQGARRELVEETGLRVGDLAGPVWHRVAEFDFAGQRYRQSEVFFVARIARHDVDTSGFDDVERSAITGHRWWSLDELACTDDVVHPRALTTDLGRFLVGDLPVTPYEVA